MSIKSGFKMMALALIIAIAGSLVGISNVHATVAGNEPGAGERWAGPAIEGTVIITLIDATFAGKCKNQACPEIGVVFPNDAGLPTVAADLLFFEIDADTTELVPGIEACHTFVDVNGDPVPGDTVANVMKMGINEVITFQALDGDLDLNTTTPPDRVVAQVKWLFIVPDPE